VEVGEHIARPWTEEIISAWEVAGISWWSDNTLGHNPIWYIGLSLGDMRHGRIEHKSSQEQLLDKSGAACVIVTPWTNVTTFQEKSLLFLDK
jgi:hypothetical protein